MRKLRKDTFLLGRGQGGRDVAYRWRIRQKLILTHGLVVAIVALLLGGTLYGMASYRSSTRAVDKKIQELSKAEDFRGKVKTLADPAGFHDPTALRRKIDDAHQALEEYDKTLKDNGAGPDSQYAEHELGLANDLHSYLGRLDTALAGFQPAVNRSPEEFLKSPFGEMLNKLKQTADDLNNSITAHLYGEIIETSKKDINRCLWLVLTTTGVGVVMMVGSLRFFYRWVFYPIRDLQQGVNRVATGDFKHRIDIKSADEIQDLAAAFNDMTRRLDEMYTDLARQVNERSRQLVRSERLASVGFLAAGVAHEINNPLASIVFCSEALERRILDLLSQVTHSSVAADEAEVITKYLKMIQEESLRCKDITSRLLEFSRGGERQREPVDLGEMVKGVLDMVQHLPNHRGKMLTFLPAPRTVALVNAQEIKSVVVNLVVNALDSMDEGGQLKIALGIHDGMAELVFQDTGCGMTGDVLENIFEPFYTRSRSGKGTGLGLSICHRIINQHQGEIEAQSAGPNQGSTFTVRLPLEPLGEAFNKVDRDVVPVLKERGSMNRGRKAA
jgi:two-component system NtrC family sensor kinase